jgi:hypothetical protein
MVTRPDIRINNRSISLTRELMVPTNGNLALSNNIPILTDEIGRLAQSLVAKEAGPSVFSQIVKGVLSLQTAMGDPLLKKGNGIWAKSLARRH